MFRLPLGKVAVKQTSISANASRKIRYARCVFDFGGRLNRQIRTAPCGSAPLKIRTTRCRSDFEAKTRLYVENQNFMGAITTRYNKVIVTL